MTAPTRRTRAGLAVVLVALGLLLSGLTAPASAATRVVLGGVAVALPAGSTQVVTVNHTRSWRATVVLWQRGPSGWKALARAADGRTGYGGLVVGSRRKQGTGTTPLGTYSLLSAFGTHARATSWKVGYHRITSDDWWVEDNGSAYYNRMRGKSQGGFRWWLTSGPNTSERLADYPRQYEYAINTGFNRAQVRYRGAGIFLHVNGRGATAGCISAPRWFLRTAMARLDPARKPVIAIGR